MKIFCYFSRGLPDLVQQAHTVSPVNLNTKPEHAEELEQGDDGLLCTACIHSDSHVLLQGGLQLIVVRIHRSK